MLYPIELAALNAGWSAGLRNQYPKAGRSAGTGLVALPGPPCEPGLVYARAVVRPGGETGKGEGDSEGGW